MKLKIKVLFSMLMLFCLGTFVFIIYFLNQNPLISDGYSEYYNQRKQMDISLVNKGIADIYIQEIKINNKHPLQSHLVISY